MSKKHKAAIEAQQYTPKLISGTCGNCAHVVDVIGQRSVFVDPSNFIKGTRMADVVVGHRCGIGGFPVKKLGSCCEHAFAATGAAA